MATFETLQEGETYKFWVDLPNEAPFDLMKIYWKTKIKEQLIAKAAYPATTGYITMTKSGDRYTCVVPKKNRNRASWGYRCRVSFSKRRST